MNDKELIKLAAKAVGIIHPGGEHRVYNDGRVWYCKELRWWNPLTDDGDALRLADKLNMAVYFSASGKTAEAPDGPGPVWEETDYRRAIVRAAAEIGKGMREFPSAEEIRTQWGGE